MSELIWKKIGAEHNAFFTVDGAATALADGGFNASLRDYTRFGLMMQNDGYVGNTAVVPKSWVDQCASPDILRVRGASQPGNLPTRRIQ